MPTLNNYWRSIVCLATLLEKAETGVSEVPLNASAEVYADNICQHLIKSPIQGTNPTNSYLQTCRDYNLGKVERTKLIEPTNRTGFRYVFDAFHNISGGEPPLTFFSIGKEANRLVAAAMMHIFSRHTTLH